MRIDLPQCGLHQCRYQFDGNCKSKDKYKLCEFVNERQQWIPCSERLPEDGETVLVQFDDGNMDILTFPNIYKRLNRVAWMPLPEPYEEENNEVE